MKRNEVECDLSEPQADFDRLVMLRKYGPLNANQMLVGEYRLTGRTNKRLNLQAWLSRMTRKGKIKRVGRGLYEAT